MKKIKWRIGLSVSLLSLFAGCMGSDSDTVGDSILADGKVIPYTDAYIVYPGPNAKWVGPDTFTVHLSAQSPDTARISIASRMLKSQASSKTPLRASSNTVSVDAAREEIARLSTALKGQEVPFQGCLSPVRVKLIRADGALIERQGCRGQAGWPKVASEFVNHLLESSVISPEIGSRKLSAHPTTSVTETTLQPNQGSKAEMHRNSKSSSKQANQRLDSDIPTPDQ